MDFNPGRDSGWIYSYPRILTFLDGLSITENDSAYGRRLPHEPGMGNG